MSRTFKKRKGSWFTEIDCRADIYVRDFYFDKRTRKYRKLPDLEIDALFERAFYRRYCKSKSGTFNVPRWFRNIFERKFRQKCKGEISCALTSEDPEVVLSNNRPKRTAWFWF